MTVGSTFNSNFTFCSVSKSIFGEAISSDLLYTVYCNSIVLFAPKFAGIVNSYVNFTVSAFSIVGTVILYPVTSCAYSVTFQLLFFVTSWSFVYAIVAPSIATFIFPFPIISVFSNLFPVLFIIVASPVAVIALSDAEFNKPDFSSFLNAEILGSVPL